MRKPSLTFRILLTAMALTVTIASLAVTQPVLVRGVRPRPPGDADVSPAALERHVRMLSETLAPRDLKHAGNLDRTAIYLARELRSAGLSVTEQTFLVDGKTAVNVLARPRGSDLGPFRVVVGAHYDAFGGLPGADDDASGVAGLLELGRLVAGSSLPVELAAYTLEEPPYFGSTSMGSAVHARALAVSGAKVRAMLALEMIGRFSREKGSQDYPLPALSLLYPRAGDFIAIAGRPSDRALIRTVKVAMSGLADLRVRSMCAPPSLGGTDLSDHASFWKEGIPAALVTDTAFFRNHDYHTAEDTADRLDYRRMADVVLGVRDAVASLCERGHGP